MVGEAGGLFLRNVSIEVEGRVSVLTIKRSGQLNVLNEEVLKDLSTAMDKIEEEPRTRAVVVTGEGQKAFAAGADVSEMERLDVQAALDYSRFGKTVFRKIEECSRPTIAAINGYALGGGLELALSCDLRVAAENARFGQPEVGLGIIPGFGGTQRLARLVGKGVAMEMILSGSILTAADGLRVGLVNKVVPEGMALKEAIALGVKIADKSPYAVRQAKKAVLDGLRTSLAEGLRLEENLFSECFANPEQKEGMRAFLEKRSPRF